MAALQSVDGVFAQAYKDAVKHGSGFYQTGILSGILQAKQVPQSDVFRFRFMRGKSHSHSRKIWRERLQRSFTWSSARVTYELPNPTAEGQILRRLIDSMNERISACMGLPGSQKP